MKANPPSCQADADNADPFDFESAPVAQLLEAYDNAIFGDRESAGQNSSVHELQQDRLDELAQAQGIIDRLARAGRMAGVPTDVESLNGTLWEDAPEENCTPLPSHLAQFEVVRVLGRGGLGVVLLAKDPLLQREVALKVPRPETLLSSDAKARFRVESRAAARLSHPNIIGVHEVVDTGLLSMIVSDYCPGPSLAEWLSAKDEPVEPRSAAAFIATLADAVHYAHCRGVLHRDIKPSNVLLEAGNRERNEGTGNREQGTVAKDNGLDSRLLGNDGGKRGNDGSTHDQRQTINDDLTCYTPKLTDFGLAKLTDDATDRTRAGAIVGTPTYMAPEQASADVDAIGVQTDVYALGTTLYELLTGHTPFASKSSLETLRRIQFEEPSPPRKYAPSLSRDLEAIVLKCLEKNPNQRYASADALATDLKRYLNGEPTLARPLGPAMKLLRWARRKPLLAALNALALLLLILVAVISTVALMRIAEERNRALDALTTAEFAKTQEQYAKAEALAQADAASREAKRALKEAATSDRLADLLAGLFQGTDATGLRGLGVRPQADLGRDLTSRDLLKRGVEFVNSKEFEEEDILVRANLGARLSNACLNAGMLEEANQLSAKALTLLQEASEPASDEDYALVKHARGVCLMSTENYKEAERLLRESLRHAENSVNAGKLDVLRLADIQFDLAWALAARVADTAQDANRDYQEAESLFRDVLSIRKREQGSDHPDVTMAVTAIAMLMIVSSHETSLTDNLKKELLTLYRTQPVGLKFDQAIFTGLAGLTARKMDYLDSAIENYEKTVQQIESLSAGDSGSLPSPASSPILMLVLGELAGTYKQNGQYREAEAAFGRLLQISDEVLPNGHPRLIGPLLEGASELSDRQDYVGAERFARRALAVAVRYRKVMPSYLGAPLGRLVHDAVLGQDDERFTATLEECLSVVREVGRDTPTAVEACLHAILGGMRGLEKNPRLPFVLSQVIDAGHSMGTLELPLRTGVAGLWSRAGNLKECQLNLDQALRFLPAEERVLTRDELAWFAAIVGCELEIGNLELAEKHTRQTLAQNYDYPDVRAWQQSTLAAIAKHKGDWSSATRHYKQAVDEWLACSEARGITLPNAYIDLAIAQLAAGQAAESLESMKEGLRLLSKRADSESNPLEWVTYTVEAIKVLEIASARQTTNAEEIRAFVSETKNTMMKEIDALSAKAIVERLGEVGGNQHGNTISARPEIAAFLTLEEQKLWDRSTGEQAVLLLSEAIKVSDSNGKSFPTWRIRQEVELELGRWLITLERYEEAESHLSAVLKRCREALDPKHVLVIATERAIEELHKARGRPTPEDQ